MILTKQQEEILSGFLIPIHAAHYVNAESIEEWEKTNRLYYSSDNFKDAKKLINTNPSIDAVFQQTLSAMEKDKGKFLSDRIHAIKTVLANNKFDKLGCVLPNAEYNKVKGDTILELYRGVRSAKEIDDFKYNDFYIGEHLSGNGMYFTTDYFLALTYAHNVPKHVMRVKIDLSELYVVDGSIVEVAMFTEPNVKEWFHLFGNVGNYAAAKNIEAVRRVEEFGTDVYFILNRSKIIIEQDVTDITDFIRFLTAK